MGSVMWLGEYGEFGKGNFNSFWDNTYGEDAEY